MTERNKFQELLETIKKYKDNVTDYAYSTQVGGRSSPDKTRNYSYSKETYEISSPELKKEARKIIFGEDKAGDGGLYRLGLSPDSGNTFYSYEKGDGSQPDKFEIEFNPERRRKEKEQIDREQRRRDREQAERDRQQVERDRKEKQNSPDSFSFRDKKCAECGQEIDFTKGIIRSKPDRQEEWLHFCSVECSKKHSDKKHDERKNKQNDNSPWGKKCAGCNCNINSGCIEGDGQGNWYCSPECTNKNHKPKTEIEKTHDRLQNLKNKLANSSNSEEKQRLEQEIKNTEDHLKGLKNNKGNQKKQPNQTSSPKAGYGKIILAGAVIFSVVILASILIARTRKKVK